MQDDARHRADATWCFYAARPSIRRHFVDVLVLRAYSQDGSAISRG